MPDQRHPDALRLMRLAEQEIARIATEVGPREAAQAAVMTAVRSLGTLYFAVGFEAAMLRRPLAGLRLSGLRRATGRWISWASEAAYGTFLLGV